MTKSFSKYRYLGRFVGLSDAIGMKFCALSAEQFYILTEEQRQVYINAGIHKFECLSIIKELLELSRGINDLSLPQNQYEYKIGIREGMLLFRNDQYLPRLTLPISFLPDALLNRIK